MLGEIKEIPVDICTLVKSTATPKSLNTVLAVSECLSFAKLWQEKGCCSQAETWQVENILMKDFE